MKKRIQTKRAPGDFRIHDVVYIFGSNLPGVVTGVVVEVDAEQGRVRVVPKGGAESVWFMGEQLKRIAGRGGPK